MDAFTPSTRSSTPARLRPPADSHLDADWTISWRKTTVSDADWKALRAALRAETHRWLDAMRKPRDVDEAELNGVMGSLAHLAYHLGAIRQMDRAVRGPSATD